MGLARSWLSAYTLAMKVGVIMPVYNRGPLVLQALQSIAAQSRSPDRVVVVDDGSTDDTSAQIETWSCSKGNHLNLQLIRQENRGVGAARIRAATELRDCELLASLDSDDLWPADYLKRMIEAMENNPDAVGAGTNRKVINMKTGETVFKNHSGIEQDTAYQFILGNMPTPSLSVIRESAYRDAGGFNPRLHRREDSDLYLRLCLQGRWVFVPGEPVIMRRLVGEQSEAADNLTEGYHSLEGELLRMQVIDAFIFHYGGVRALEGSPWKQWVSKRWRRIGKALSSQEKKSQAAWCFLRAWKVKKLDHKALYYWLTKCHLRRPHTPFDEDHTQEKLVCYGAADEEKSENRVEKTSPRKKIST